MGGGGWTAESLPSESIGRSRADGGILGILGQGGGYRK